MRLQSIFLLLLLVGCGTREVLEPIDGTVPQGVNLSGNWSLRRNAAADEKRLQQAIRRTDGVTDRELMTTDVVSEIKRGSGTSRSRRLKAGLVHVFLETGRALKVTQTDHALFVSFDRSVVEEFRFGEQRIISIGEVQAQRVCGWVDKILTVETLDKNGMKMTERYRLVDGGRTLERAITFRSKKLEEETIIQEFDRAD